MSGHRGMLYTLPSGEALTQEDRRRVALRVIDGRTTAEGVASSLGVNERTVRRWVVDAMEQPREPPSAARAPIATQDRRKELASQSLKEGNIVRYVGRERRDQLGRGQMWRVTSIAKTGKIRLAAMNGAKKLAAPVWVMPDEIEYVSASSSLGAGPHLPVAQPDLTQMPAPKVASVPAITSPFKPKPSPIGEVRPSPEPEPAVGDGDKAKLDKLLEDGPSEPAEVAGETLELEGVGCVVIESRKRSDGTRKVCVTVSEDADVSDGVRALVLAALGVA